jgi:membrane-associated phospholipid phosphatase
VPRRSGPDLVPHLPPTPDRRLRDRLWFAGYYLVAFVALGLVVSGKKPALIDVSARALVGAGTKAALLLTETGLFPVYATISVVLLIAGIVERRWLRAVLISIVTLLAAWQVSDACKGVFQRPRPNYWVLIHEPSWSYPSGHTTLVIAFYGFWTAVAWMSDLPLVAKRWIRIAFAIWAIAIGWARLALGAHYLTDVVGGYLLGAAMASLAVVVYRILGNPAETDPASP